jgi:DtxR family transcriptional regulator, Mn-dependent transcriptional regulator
MSNKLHSKQKDKISTEMYLKTIFLLNEKKNDVKPVDLVNELGLVKGSVSEMIKKLSDQGLINYESYGSITLTKKGLTKAKNVVRKYLTVKRFLRDVIKTSPDKIHDEACNLEHAFSDESIAKLNVLNKLMEQNSK